MTAADRSLHVGAVDDADADAAAEPRRQLAGLKTLTAADAGGSRLRALTYHPMLFFKHWTWHLSHHGCTSGR